MTVTESILGSPAASTHGNLGQSARFPLFHTPPESGAGAGGGSPQGTGAPSGGSPQGTGAPQGGQPGGGSGGTQHSRFDPNGMYDFGDGKPVKGSDYLAGFVPRTEHEKLHSNYQKGRDFLIQEATKLEQQWKQIQQQGRGRQASNVPAPNPFDKFKDMPVIDGAALTEAYQAMRQGDIQPIIAVVRQQQQMLQQMQQQMTQVRTGFGGITEQQQTAAHASRVDQAIGQIGTGYDAKNPLLREIADDVYLSHDPKDPNLDKEFPMMLKNRIDGLRKMFREMDKAAVDAAKGQKRIFARPGGNATPNGPSRYQHENGTTLARRLFGEQQGQAT